MGTQNFFFFLLSQETQTAKINASCILSFTDLNYLIAVPNKIEAKKLKTVVAENILKEVGEQIAGELREETWGSWVGNK